MDAGKGGGKRTAAGARERGGALTAVAAWAALAAGGVMAATLMLIAEVSAEPTAVAGVDSSTWTPLTAITSFVFGADAYHASFDPLSIAFGTAAHIGFSLLFGAAGVALLVWLLGHRPNPAAAALVGLGYGLSLEVLFLNLAVNAVEDENRVYESLPEWGWWVAHAAFGLALALVAAAMLARAVPRGGAKSPLEAVGETSRR